MAYRKKTLSFWFGMEPPTRRSRSKSANKCIPYNNRCAKLYPDRLRFGSTRAKTSFGVKAERPRLYMAVKEAQLMLTNPHNALSGQSRSSNSSTIPYVRYSFLLEKEVTLSLRGAIFTIFDFKNVMTLKSGSESLKVIESSTIRKIVYGFLLVFFSNIVPKMHRF